MIEALRQLLRPKPTRPPPSIPSGQRVYAVGDVHGRVDLFGEMIAAIERDDVARGPADTTIVLLGDLVDRGPDSAKVIALARELASRRNLRIVAGNHEEMFLDSFERTEHLSHFLRVGGLETVLSYPVDPDAFTNAEPDEAMVQLNAAVPECDREFIRGFEESVAIGDYFFVHAGIRPRVALDAQQSADLRWIREPFLSYGKDHERVIVHGHTITSEPEVLPNRIGIDTGAFRSGRLTALGLERTERWLIEAREDEGTLTSFTRPA